MRNGGDTLGMKKGGGRKRRDRLLNLNGVLIGEQVDDVECVLNDADSHQLRKM